MQTILYKLFFALLWTISKLPWWLFYKLCDLCYVIVFYMIGYRKKVVYDNLSHAFPEKNQKEIKAIMRKSYRYMCDMFLEMTRSITISDEELSKRYVLKNPEMFRYLEQSGRSAVLLAAHYANFEWSNALCMYTTNQVVAAFKPVKNTYFNDLVYKLRSRLGAEVVASKDFLRHAFLKEKEDPGRRIYGLIADQTPRIKKDQNIYKTFLGRTVPVFVGGEALAKKKDLIVTYAKVDKVKRGFYEIEIVIIDEDISDYNNFEATEKYYKLVESQIKQKPELYLWTHKRWKYAQ